MRLSEKVPPREFFPLDLLSSPPNTVKAYFSHFFARVRFALFTGKKKKLFFYLLPTIHCPILIFARTFLMLSRRTEIENVQTFVNFRKASA